jgi:alpha-D-ribose 1-methylphosphonate 5-triphosphate diphosphatase
MSQHLVFHNARMLVDDDIVHGQLAVQGEYIAAMDRGASALPQAIDLEGDLLIPGLLEVHTDNFERHMMPRPKVPWPAMPALLAHDAEIVAAGITTVFDALGVGEADPESVRGRDLRPVLATLEHCLAHGLLRSDHHLHVRCELPAPNTVALFEPFQDHPRLRLISVMDHTPGQRQWENLTQARTYYTGKKGWSDEKFNQQVALGPELQARYAAPHRHYFVDYCRSHGIALASHDDTTAAHVAQAHEEGVRMVEFPTSLVAARAARARGMFNIMGAPNVVRGGSHSGNVAAHELAAEGLLDMLSSDYVPGGLLCAALRLHQDGLMSLPQALNTVTRTPAQATGMSDRGRLAPGLRADLVRVRLVPQPDGTPHGVVRQVWRQGLQVL